MSVLFIERHSVLAYENNYFIITDKNDMQSFRQIPVYNIEMIVGYADIEFSGSMLAVLMERKIPMLLNEHDSRRINGCISYEGGNAMTETLIKHVTKAQNPEFACMLGKAILYGKVQNQIRYLKKRGENAKTAQYEATIISLEKILKKAMRTDTVRRLRGYEGALARMYFRVFPSLMNNKIPFPGRINYHPTDIINAMLNIGYGYIGDIIYNQLVINNLKPDIGFIHNDHGRYATLMYDMIEEWRTLLVDQVVIGMVNNNMVNPEDYHISPDNPEKLIIKYDLREKLKNQIFDKLKTTVKIDTNKADIDGRIIRENKSYNQLIERQVKKLKEVIISDDYIHYEPYTGN